MLTRQRCHDRRAVGQSCVDPGHSASQQNTFDARVYPVVCCIVCGEDPDGFRPHDQFRFTCRQWAGHSS
ncbi:hypothetical protein AAER40_27810, partial [Klebsiella pneumoniae]